MVGKRRRNDETDVLEYQFCLNERLVVHLSGWVLLPLRLRLPKVGRYILSKRRLWLGLKKK